jgi:phage gp29-like protein
MATKEPRLERPITDELAKSRGRGTLVGQPFVELLTPDDSVLISKGRDYRLYRETLRDDQCASTFADRRLAVTSKEWQVDAGGDAPIDVQAADFIREELQRIEWDRITDGMLYARWYGHAIAEAIYYQDGAQVHLQDIKVRDRSRFAYSNDGGIWLLSEQGQWQRMPDRKFWKVDVGADNDDQPYGLGLAHYAYWPVFFKRNDLKFWLVFAEKFGSPTAVGKIPGGKWGDEKLKDTILDSLMAFSSDSAIVVPEETTVELLEAARSGTGTYDQLYDRMDAALAKVIIGQTASTQGTAGKLGGEELRGQVRDDLVKADADLICGSFNRQVVTWLTEWNFPGAATPKVWRKTEPDVDLLAMANTDKAIKELGFTPSEEYIQEAYGAHWTKAVPPPGLAGNNPFAGPQDPNAIDQAAAFAEAGAIATLKAGKRSDQESIKNAAAFLAARYEDVIGDRVRQLLAFADETKDYATFQTHLAEMIKDLPPANAVDSIHRANVFSRLLGRLKAQR